MCGIRTFQIRKIYEFAWNIKTAHCADMLFPLFFPEKGAAFKKTGNYQGSFLRHVRI
jgi:hypothetical protein